MVSAAIVTANELHLPAPKRNLRRFWRLKVPRIATCLTLLVIATACETSTDNLIGIGGGGGGAVTQAQVAGDWSFTVRKTTTLPCTGGSLADGQILTSHLDAGSDGTINAGTSNWQNPPTTLIRPLSGAVRLTDGFTDLILSASAGSASAMELRGTLASSGTFTGTVTDPGPGFTPMFGSSGCEYTAAGTKG